MSVDFTAARGSNTGDSFHEVWALRQALGLLRAETALSAVTIEGISDETEGKGPPWHAVDCGLLYGGFTVESADRVEIAQLKYSASEPTTPWTLARLVSPRDKPAKSVLRKLATDFAEAQSRKKAGAKLRVRFVTNQPAHAAVLTLIDSVRKGSVPPSCQPDFETVREATGLSDDEVRAFLTALDMSECGTTTRFAEEEALILAIANLREGTALVDLNNMLGQIGRLMLPESAKQVITQETVLAWLGISDLKGLFPVQSDIAVVTDPVARTSVRYLADKLIDGSRLTCFHGKGGSGKTTALQQLPAALPSGSLLVTYDCFGGGRYMAPEDQRHLPRKAFLQIVNDFAAELRTPYLIPRDSGQHVSIEEFLIRLHHSAEVMAEARPGSLLVLVVDAADNAAAAAERPSPADPCFATQLAQVHIPDLPDNVRIVLSARTSRLERLQLPRAATLVECPPFSLHETEEFVRRWWPAAGDSWVEEFHARTGGIPRIQRYAVGAAGDDPDRALAVFAGQTAGDLTIVLQQQFHDAGRRLGDDSAFRHVVEALSVLRPAIPIQHVAAVSGTAPELVEDVINDVVPGMRREGRNVIVADEDFAAFLDEETESRREATWERIAEYLLGVHAGDEYGAIHVAEALIMAGRRAELLDLVQKDEAAALADRPVDRRLVILERLRLALRACRELRDPAETLKVVLLRAEASREESALREVLQKHVDLGVAFDWPSLERVVLADRQGEAQRGSLLAHGAARSAARGDRETTRHLLYAHDEWMERRKHLSQRERQGWEISHSDVAARARAILEAYGPDLAVRELLRWKPKWIAIEVALELIPSLIASGKTDVLKTVLDRKLLSAPWDLVLAVPLAMAGETIPPATLAHSLAVLEAKHLTWGERGAFRRQDRICDWLDIILTACELARNLHVESKPITHAVTAVRSALPPDLAM